MTRQQLHERFNNAASLLYSLEIVDDDIISLSITPGGFTEVHLEWPAFYKAFQGREVTSHSFCGKDHLHIVWCDVKFTAMRTTPAVVEVATVL